MSVTRFEGERTLSEAHLTAVTDPRRRNTLAVLQGRESSVDRRDLAEQVAAIEREVERSDVSESDVDDVLLTLHHVHLPKLEDAGYLAYDESQELVTPRSASEDEERILADL